MTELTRLGVEYRIVGPVPEAREELPLLLRVVVRNTGTATWPSRAACDGPWSPLAGRAWAGGRVRRCARAAARQYAAARKVSWSCRSSRRSPGKYLLALDMVQENVAWFSQQGVDWLVVPLTVMPRGRLARDAPCIFGPVCP